MTRQIAPWRHKLRVIIFGTDTRAGKAFDLVLLVLILISVASVVMESVASVRADHGTLLKYLEWGITALFTIEYALRLICVEKPWRYAVSFYGLVDLTAILPSYLGLFIGGAHSLLVVRALRLLRVFRILKLAHFVSDSQLLGRALKASRRKILVFMGVVSTLILIIGTLMYLIEGSENGFSSIPQSMYWAVVTLTTVGYGDIAPQTVAGKILASIVMMIGYAIIAVPTGIVSVELSRARAPEPVTGRSCGQCGRDGHDSNADYCKHCGHPLDELGQDGT